MLAKSWKKICLIILIIACLWNIILKISYNISFKKLVDSFQNRYEQTNTNNV